MRIAAVGARDQDPVVVVEEDDAAEGAARALAGSPESIAWRVLTGILHLRSGHGAVRLRLCRAVLVLWRAGSRARGGDNGR